MHNRTNQGNERSTVVVLFNLVFRGRPINDGNKAYCLLVREHELSQAVQITTSVSVDSKFCRKREFSYRTARSTSHGTRKTDDKSSPNHLILPRTLVGSSICADPRRLLPTSTIVPF